jgi:hypothetical protein
MWSLPGRRSPSECFRFRRAVSLPTVDAYARVSTYRELWATVNSHLTSAFVVSEGGLELTPSRFSRVLPRPAIRALTSAFPFVRGTPVSSGTAFYCTVRCNRLASGPDRCANTCRGLDRPPGLDRKTTVNTISTTENPP